MIYFISNRAYKKLWKEFN